MIQFISGFFFPVLTSSTQFPFPHPLWLLPLIGKTGLIQRTLLHKCAALRDRIVRGERIPAIERRILFTGPPGIGKTTLADELALLIAGDKFAIEKVNGQNLNIELVREWTRNACYRPMAGQVCIKHVEEIDAISNAAANDIRTYLDDLAWHRVFIACTNLPVKKLQEQLQSRFQVFKFEAVPCKDITEHLREKFNLSYDDAFQIAMGCEGNVRAAECDARTHCDVVAALSQPQPQLQAA